MKFPLLFTLLASSIAAVAPGQWQSAEKLNIPKYSYAFLASTPNGDLLATTFNSAGPTSPPKDMPALLIENPSITSTPRILELCRSRFEPQRGFGGVACDLTGSFFLSGDTGNSSTCFVKKFHQNGQPDTAFGQNGEIRPNRRTLGMDVVGKYLLVAVDWAQIMVLASDTGKPLGMVNVATGGEVNVRDIAIDPKSMRIFGVASGAVVTWGNGTPWKPGAYQYRALSKAYGNPRAGEGLSLDPFNRTVLITPKPGNVLLEIDGSLNVKRFTIDTAMPTTHLADSVMSFDGSSLYVSDMTAQSIHVMKRPAPRGTLLVASAPSPTTMTTESLPFMGMGADVPEKGTTTWYHSYDDVVQGARDSGKPMIVYFTQGGVPKAQDFEKSTLMTDEFNSYAMKKDFICVFEDVTKNKLTAYKFGAVRVPHLIVLGRNGDTAAEFSYNIDKAKLFGAMEAIN